MHEIRPLRHSLIEQARAADASSPHAVRLGPARLARQRRARRDPTDPPPLASRRRRRQRRRRPAARPLAISRAAPATAAGRKRSTTTCSIAACAFRRSPAAARARTTTRSARIACTSTAATSSPPRRWWEGLEAGRVFVTNGPLLRPLVEGQPPGYVFHLDDGGSLTLEIGLESGHARAGRISADHQERRGRSRSPPGRLDKAERAACRRCISTTAAGSSSGRSRTTSETYQFASSGPYYVEKAGRPRVSRRSVQFFLDWIDAAEARASRAAGSRRRKRGRRC